MPRPSDRSLPCLALPRNQVPEHLWQVTPVRLLATAGLRLVEAGRREAILDACRSLLASSRFVFRHDWAKVIGGDMEGVYAWTGANYAARALQVGAGMESRGPARDVLCTPRYMHPYDGPPSPPRSPLAFSASRPDAAWRPGSPR